MKFPSELFIESILDFSRANFKTSTDKKFSMKKIALKYVDYIKQVSTKN